MAPKPLARVCTQASRQLESAQLSAAAVGVQGLVCVCVWGGVGGGGARAGVCVGGGGCLNGSTSVFVILSCKKSTATWSTSTSVLITTLLTLRSVVTMYLTDRAGVILRHHTRSSQEGHHSQAHFRHCTPVAVAHHEKFAAEENERGNALFTFTPCRINAIVLQL